MATNKKNVKVRDLKPSKDAKGGGARTLGASTEGVHTLGSKGEGVHTLGSTKNSKQHLGHHGSGHN